jgi:sugar phosphate isomerase/epimerase
METEVDLDLGPVTGKRGIFLVGALRGWHDGGVDDRLLSLAAGTMLDVGPVEAVNVAQISGWPAVGLWYDPDTWEPRTTSAVRRRLEADGMLALDIEPIILMPAQAGSGAVLPDFAMRMLEVGGAVGARHVLVASRDPDTVRVTAALRRLCEVAEPLGMRVVLEFLPIMAVRTLADAVAIVTEVDHPAAGVLVDALHLERSGGSPGEVRSVSRHLLPYAQLCDVAPEVPADLGGLLDEALRGRLLPGDGVAPLTELVSALPAGCPLSLEMRSRTLMRDFPDPVERGRVVLAATTKVLAERSQALAKE